jgi:hypothetical protein
MSLPSQIDTLRETSPRRPIDNVGRGCVKPIKSDVVIQVSVVMNTIRRFELVGLAAIVVLAATCTNAVPPQPNPGAEVTSGASPDDLVASPTDRIPLLTRLREEEGVYKGVPLPRMEHWHRGREAATYRSAFKLCSRIGLADLAVQLHVRPVDSVVAIEVLAAYPSDAWRTVHQGCIDGLVWDARAS